LIARRRSQFESTPPPRQVQPHGTAHAEFVICDCTIEQSFRDDKSGGFDMAHTKLQHPERLERLLLAVALATLWCHELGEQVVFEGEATRREIDPGPERELSIFQLGLRWLKRCIATAIQRLPAFQARLTPIRLEPVIREG